MFHNSFIAIFISDIVRLIWVEFVDLFGHFLKNETYLLEMLLIERKLNTILYC